MAVPKGTRIAGRAKGTPNKDTQELLDIAKKHNCDPFEILILYAKRDHKALGLPEKKIVGYSVSGDEIEALSISVELQQKSAKDACEYLYPKRKALEITGKDGEKLFSYEEYLKSLNEKKG